MLSSRSFQGGSEPLTIYGPKGIKNFVLTSLQVSESRLGYPLNFVELTGEGRIFHDQTFTVYAKKLDHKIACFGYRVVEADHPGALNVEKLRAAGVPSGPLYGQLKAGKTVKLADGRILNGKDFIGQDQPGRIVAILGDTRKTPAAVALGKDADVLVHESTFAKNEPKMARAYYHSTSKQAAEVARDAHAKRLLLTHISARYTGKAAYQLAYSVRNIFPNTRVVNDFDVYDIPLKKGGKVNAAEDEGVTGPQK